MISTLTTGEFFLFMFTSTMCLIELRYATVLLKKKYFKILTKLPFYHCQIYR